MRLIGELGYRMYWHMPPLFNPDNYYGVAENIYPDIVSINLLCVPREASPRIDGLAEVTDVSSHPLRR
jgi:hypothetical protein